MKGRSLVLDTGAAALMVDGVLEDLIVDPPPGQRSVGDICVVQVARVLPGGNGAFCTMEGGEGFLRDARGIRNGARLLAQVTSLPEPGKAVALTQRVLVKGPRLILTLTAPGVNVSRAIKDPEERARLKAGGTAALDASGLGDCGLIVRTAAMAADGAVLQQELECLASMLAAAQARFAAGGLSSGTEGNAVATALRDWLSPLPDQIVVPRDRAAEMMAGPDLWFDDTLADRLVPEAAPMDATGAADATAALTSEVPLGPGSLVIEPTRALVAVDVNTGGDFSPAACLKANLAAARDLPRHLRLRGLGGQIVVDFAPMAKRQRRTLDDTLRSAFRRDPIETSLIGWTQMGLFEMQRKRERRPLSLGEI